MYSEENIHPKYVLGMCENTYLIKNANGVTITQKLEPKLEPLNNKVRSGSPWTSQGLRV